MGKHHGQYEKLIDRVKARIPTLRVGSHRASERWETPTIPALDMSPVWNGTETTAESSSNKIGRHRG